MRIESKKSKGKVDVDEWIKQFLVRFTSNILPLQPQKQHPKNIYIAHLPFLFHSLKFSKDKKWLHFLYFSSRNQKPFTKETQELVWEYNIEEERKERAGGWKKNCRRILQSKVSEKNVYKKGKRTYFDCVTHLVFFRRLKFCFFALFFRHTADIIWGMKGTDTEKNKTQLNA